jgi:hypothetical protein
MVEKDFPGADVRYEVDFNAGWSDKKKIPPEEGGGYDERGRYARSPGMEVGITVQQLIVKQYD